MYATAAAALLGPRLRGFNNGKDASVRIAVVGLAKMLLFFLWNIPFVHSSPIIRRSLDALDGDDGVTPDDPSMWVYLGTAVALVVLGGAFAGLTIAYVLEASS